MSEIPPLVITVGALAGVCLGSFFGVLVARVPLGLPVVLARSRCDGCRATLAARDLIPVISWLVLRGRCRHCGEAVSPTWLLMEVGTGVLVALALAVAPDVPTGALFAVFLGTLLTLSVIDIRTHRLPDRIVLPAIAIAAALIAIAQFIGAAPTIAGAAIGAGAYGGGMWLVYETSFRVYRGREAMGFGDVKLATLIGLVIGAVDRGSVAVAAGAAILLGGIVAMVALVRGAERGTVIAFGPMLASGAAIAVLAGPRLFDAYMGLFS